MTADPDRATLDAAWGTIPQSHQTGTELGSFTRIRVERIIGLAIAVGCVALGGQGFVAALDATAVLPGWYPALLLVVFIPLVLMIIACVLGRGRRVLGALFVLAFTVSVLLWPIAAAGLSTTPDAEPWPFYLLNVATVAAVLSIPLSWQIASAIVIPVLWGVVRFIQCGLDPAFVMPVLLDVAFALILGGILVTLGWMFRSVATNVDTARAQAVSSYAAAAAAAAGEQERVAVGALMHDSVLAALIAVERAESERARTLAVGMSREALTRLANTDSDAEMGSEAPVDVESVARAIEASAAEQGYALRVQRVRASTTGVAIPGVVARALALAAAQAVANAIAHADAAGLEVSMVSSGPPADIGVRVRDSGPGFDIHAVPDDRLGISASIMTRVAAVGGRAHIDSDARGTVVTLEWGEAG
ncbi:hypothetical protein GCM10022240_21140 [Microbacterium kribbense]|uniref:Histidine kinase/HSP90-like ATPase domain-containing protein n=1 Tax=Microbacterium kribbense TaxID=433645 RepID=A0ABP7GLY6_9MICO